MGEGCLGLSDLLLALDVCAGGEGDLGGEPGGVLGEHGVVALGRGPSWRYHKRRICIGTQGLLLTESQ